MNNQFLRYLNEIKKVWYIPAMIAIGIVLLLVRVEPEESVAVSTTDFSNRYVEETERCIADMLGGIDGVGECVVTITLADNGKKEYVRENGNVLVITDDEGNQQPVVSKEKAPDIAGVTISCAGAESIAVREQIIKSVSTVLGIGTNKIYVVMLSR